MLNADMNMDVLSKEKSSYILCIYEQQDHKLIVEIRGNESSYYYYLPKIIQHRSNIFIFNILTEKKK